MLAGAGGGAKIAWPNASPARGLFTNAPFRREFFAHPERAALDFGLTEDEASTLKAVEAKSVAQFVDSLSQKRLADARKTLPMTARALGAQFERLTARTRYAAKLGTPSRRRREIGRAHRTRRGRRAVASAVDCRSCSIRNGLRRRRAPRRRSDPALPPLAARATRRGGFDRRRCRSAEARSRAVAALSGRAAPAHRLLSVAILARE